MVTLLKDPELVQAALVEQMVLYCSDVLLMYTCLIGFEQLSVEEHNPLGY